MNQKHKTGIGGVIRAENAEDDTFTGRFNEGRVGQYSSDFAQTVSRLSGLATKQWIVYHQNDLPKNVKSMNSGSELVTPTNQFGYRYLYQLIGLPGYSHAKLTRKCNRGIDQGLPMFPLKPHPH